MGSVPTKGIWVMHDLPDEVTVKAHHYLIAPIL
jgi:hypothetical protein